MISLLREWRRRALRFLQGRPDTPADVIPGPRLEIRRIESLGGYRDHIALMGTQAWEFDLALAEANPDVPFKVEGRCWVDNAPVAFEMDYLYAHDLGTRRIPNWRERMLCPICHLNNRQRASIHVATEYLGLRPESRIYMTEQVTPAYALMCARHASVVGSEFLAADAAPGSTNGAGIRHEDLTRLSFPDASFDAILTFDVLEHIPDYRRALAECHRVLKRGGCMLFSIPFLEDSQETRTRARFDAQGALVHDHPPVYHGDPVNPEQGVLCFHEFGWDILDHARAAGFSDAAALVYRDPGYGYLGGWPLLFAARK